MLRDMLKDVGKDLKKFGIIKIILILLLAALCVYVNLPSRRNVSEMSEEGIVSEEQTGSIGKGHRALQFFRFKKDVTLRSVNLRFDLLDGAVNTDYVTIFINDKLTSTEIARTTLKVSDIKDGEMTKVRFKGGVSIKANTTYRLIITGPAIAEGNQGPSIYLANFTSPNKHLYVNGGLVKNLCLDITYVYDYDDSFNVLGFYICGLILMVLLLSPRWFWRRLSRVKGIGWALFCINPYIVFYFTQWFYEISRIEAAVLLFNCLLLFALQGILYAVIGNKYITIISLDVVCFALAAVNLQVSLFKGVPLAPSDFLFLKTAFEVSDNYTIDWTHTQLRFMVFMATYVLVLVYTTIHAKSEETRQREEGLWYLLRTRVFAKKKAAEVKLQEDDADDNKANEETSVEAAEKENEQTPMSDSSDAPKPKKVGFWRRHYYVIGKTVVRIAFLVFGIMCIRNLYVTDVLAQNAIIVNVWNRNSSFKTNGLYLNFFMNFHYLKMEKPDGYSLDEVARVADTYSTSVDELSQTNAVTGADNPNVIIIMNESLADYTLLEGADNMTYNMDYLPFIHSLNENVNKGKCYVSVYGGQTANSEFECLTANSMAFMPSGSVPYQQFLKKTTFSLPIFMKTLGYETIAIHPCGGSNWNRVNAYASMDFGSFLTQNDFENPEIVRFISDKETYKKIISQFESKKEDEKLFVMSITMQNHGGYENATEWDEPIVAGEGEYSLANEYLSSAHVSDQAYEYLIDYFKDYDEPTIILMWGDHQPSIDPEFVQQVIAADGQTPLQQAQEQYCTPYILWANYDLPTTQTDGVTSNNFLANMVLEEAGLPLPRYNQIVANLQKDIKAMNAFGYMTNDGVWHSYDEETEYSEEINDYHIAEYGYFGDSDESAISDIFELPVTNRDADAKQVR